MNRLELLKELPMIQIFDHSLMEQNFLQERDETTSTPPSFFSLFDRFNSPKKIKSSLLPHFKYISEILETDCERHGLYENRGHKFYRAYYQYSWVCLFYDKLSMEYYWCGNFY